MAKPTAQVIEFDIKDRGPLNFVEIGFHNFASECYNSKFVWTQPTYTLHYVRNGKGILTFNGRTYQLNEGDLFFLPPDEPLHYCCDSNDPWCYFWFSIIHDSARDMGKAMGFSKDRPVRSLKSTLAITHLLDDLFNCDVPISTHYYMALSAFMQILVALLPGASDNESFRSESDLVSRAKEIIELNYSNADFTIDAIPQMLHISRSQLSKLFKSKTGMTLISYLIDVRLTHSALLTYEKRFSVRELSNAVGFGDERNFMRHFKRKYGMTVKDYQKRTVGRS